jgi:hypothetical protein
MTRADKNFGLVNRSAYSLASKCFETHRSRCACSQAAPFVQENFSGVLRVRRSLVVHRGEESFLRAACLSEVTFTPKICRKLD